VGEGGMGWEGWHMQLLSHLGEVWRGSRQCIAGDGRHAGGCADRAGTFDEREGRD
jgi:hypothetical protein